MGELGWTTPVPLMERVTLPREATTPRRARHYLAARLAGLGMPAGAIEELLVAVGEAVTNAVIHGGPRLAGTVSRDGVVSGAADADTAVSETDTVMVELMVRGDRVAVAVTSPGPRWHVPEAKLPDDPLSATGRGLYVMRQFADSVRIEQDRRGTTVYLIRRLRPGGTWSDGTPRGHPEATSPGRPRAG